MTSIMKYSVLRYSPSKVAGEKINIGILFSDMQGKRVEFRHTSNWRRVKSFDDELDITTLKAFVEGVKLDVDYAVESGGSFDLEKYIKFFINDFMFEREQKIQYDDWESTVKKLYSIYLRFDLEKKNRPNAKDEMDLINNLLITSGVGDVKQNQMVRGRFGDKIRYDFVTDRCKIKVLDFDGKQVNRLVNTAKTWAINSMTDPDENTYIIYRAGDEVTGKYNSDIESIKQIFEFAGASFISFDESLEILQNQVAHSE